MTNTEWNVVHAPGLKVKGSNNASQDRFMDRMIPSLAREVTQNSLDAHDEHQPDSTKVIYRMFQMETKLIPGIQQIKNSILPSAYKFWKEKNDLETLKFLNNFEKLLKQKQINVLKISDFNTKGLNQANYDSLVLGESYSVKDSEDSAGSKGIGKAAPFAISDLRMVFYNSLAIDNQERSAGVMNFVSYRNENSGLPNDYTQDSISFYDRTNQVINYQTTFDNVVRESNVFGTDLFIMGVKSYEYFQNRVVLATINNFLISILHNQLTVDVLGKVISKETLPKLIDELKDWTENHANLAEKNEFKSTCDFYRVLSDEKTIKVNLDARFNKYDFIDSPNDAELQVLQHEQANRKILQTRKAGMKISERKSINGNISFSGVFQAKSIKLNTFLKDLESADHNRWSSDRLQGERKKTAADFLTDLLHFYKATIKTNFDDTSISTVDAFGVENLLPLNRTEQSTGDKPKDSGIQSQFTGEVVTIESSKSAQVLDGDQEDKIISKEMVAAGISTGDSNGAGSNRTGGSKGDNPGNRFGVGDEKGTNGKSETGQRAVTENNRYLNINQNVKMKLIERDYTIGEYRLSLKANKKFGKAEIKLTTIGADGRGYRIKIESVTSPTNSVFLENGKIIIENVEKNSSVKIDYKVKSKLRMKMEGIVNEIKG